MDNMPQSLLIEPKEKPSDDLQSIPAENEAVTQSAAIVKEEVKEEPLDLVDSFPFVNEISNQYLTDHNYCKNEEMIDYEEFLGAAYQSGNDDISPLRPVKPKMEVIEDRVVIAVENPNSLELYDNFEDEKTAMDCNIRRPCLQSKNEELASTSGLPVSANEIIVMSLDDLKKLLKSASLSQMQRLIIRKIRRRGMNTIVAGNSRDRRVNEEITNGGEFHAAADKSGDDDMSPLSRVEPKTKVIEDRVIMSVENPTGQPFSDDFNGEAMLVDNIHRRGRHSKLDNLASSSDLSVSAHAIAKDQEAYPSDSLSDNGGSTSEEKHPVILYCPLCTIFPNNTSRKYRVARTISNMRNHLRNFHRRTVLTAKLRIDCSCGFITQNLNDVAFHAKSHSNCTFTMVKTEDSKPGINPRTCCRKEMTVIVNDVSTEKFICPFCTREVVRDLRNLEGHLKQHHQRTCKQSGLYFVCSCGYIARSPSDVRIHKKKCADSTFTMLHESVKSLPIF